MGNRVGVIFHNDWYEFSPLLYSHNGADEIPILVQTFLKEYDKQHKRCNTDGHLYNPEHMMVGFIQSLNKNVHMRIESLTEYQINMLKEHHEYPNCFDGGCWIINISILNYGKTECGDNYYLKNDNIVTDELESVYDC